MSSNNRISATITPEQLTASAELLRTFKDNLAHVLRINLEADERRAIPKMGDKTMAFVKKSLEYAVQNPTLVPHFMELEEAKRDYELAASLYEIYKQLNTLITAVDDSGMVAGSEAYEAALIFYHSVKGASKSNAPGSRAIYDDLSKRFPGQRKARTITPEP